MVLETEKYNFLEASCCKVDVVNGGAGVFFVGFFSKLFIENLESIFLFKKLTASSLELKDFESLALKESPSSVLNTQSILNEDMGVKPSISRSFSTISLTDTDCTLPAERPLLIFLHNTGDNS